MSNRADENHEALKDRLLEVQTTLMDLLACLEALQTVVHHDRFYTADVPEGVQLQWLVRKAREEYEAVHDTLFPSGTALKPQTAETN